MCFSTIGVNWSVSVINTFFQVSFYYFIGYWIWLSWMMQGIFRGTAQQEDHLDSLLSWSLLASLQQQANITSIFISLAGHSTHDTPDLLLSFRCGAHGMPQSTSQKINQIGMQWKQSTSWKPSCSISYLPSSLGLMMTKVRHIFLSLKRSNTVSTIIHIHYSNHGNVTCSYGDRPEEQEEYQLKCHSVRYWQQSCCTQWWNSCQWYLYNSSKLSIY